ncbi:hypothetical protein [Streptomyces luteogriseus]|uniref:hypothetical protein n=1 Tax=Streptomyces luteogriseus TaxID=68233 RepID=UPI0037A1A03B
MTPWLRALRAAGLVLALGAGAVVSPYGSVPSYGAALAYDEEGAAEEGTGPGPTAARTPGSAPSAPSVSSASSRPAAPPGAAAPSPRVAPSSRSAPSPLAAPSARAASPTPSAVAAASAAGEPSRAGSRAGEGRARPGRPEDAGEGPGVADVTAFPEEPQETVPKPSAPAGQPVREAAAAERPAGQVLRILPLGSGLVLIGLGLGLAFFALRLRRV